MIHGHHDGFISWDEYLRNQAILEKNQTNGENTRLTGPVREGLALLQGLLLCGNCGHRITIRYQGNGGIYPIYECNWHRREGIATKPCLCLRCDRLDEAIARRALEVMQPAQLELALTAIEELERRDQGVIQQWQMRIQQSEYEANLAERRYEQVDPANRLVASNLERRWNEALQMLEQTKKQFEEYRRSQARALTLEQKTKLLGLAQDFPQLWHAPTTSAKDKKRMLRLLIEDITVTKLEQRMVSMQVRWRGGATENIVVERPPLTADQVRASRELVQRIGELAQSMSDDQIVEQLTVEGRKPPKGKSFTVSSVRWIRNRHGIAGPTFKRPGELSVQELATLLKVSRNVVYYWIETGIVEAKRRNGGSPYFIALSETKKAELENWVRNSTRLAKGRDS